MIAFTIGNPFPEVEGKITKYLLQSSVVLLGFDGLFLRFHEVFFSGNTWRFSTRDTLLRLYPEVFWQHAGRLASAIVVLQSIVVALFACFWLRGVRPVSQGKP